MASKSAIVAGRGEVTLGTNDGPLVAGLAAAQKKFQDWGKGIAVIGAGIAAAGAAVTAPFLAGLAVFTAWGGEMRTGMRETGIGFAQLDYLTKGLGVSTEELVPAVAKMSSFLLEAANGSDTANQALAQLGLTLGELSAMSQGDRVQRLAEALGGVADASKRIGLTRAIFGRGAMDLNVSGGAAGIAARAARRDYIEGKPSEGDQQLAAETAKLFSEMAMAIKAIWREIGAAAAPVMRDFYQLVIGVLVPVREFITANRDTLTIVFRVADAMVTFGAAIVFVGGVVYAAGYAFAFLSGIVTIVGAALSWAAGWAYFAATGFGVLKLVSLAYAAVMLGVNAVVWLFNLAHAAGVAALAMFAGGTVAASAGTSGFTLALVGTWIWENLCTAGAWLLVTALGALVLVLGAVLFAIPIVAMAAIVTGIGYLIVTSREGASAWRDFSAAISTAAGDAWDSCKAAFAGILDTVTTSMGGVMNAVKAGDWALVWEIVKTGGELAWLQLTQFVEQQWIIWKYAAFATWDAITDALRDAFANVVRDIRLMWAELWGQDTMGISVVANAAQNQRNQERRDHDALAAAKRAAELAGAGSPEIAGLQAQLENLAFAARNAEADRAYAARTDEIDAPGPGDLGGTFKGQQATGSFFADAIQGMYGGSGGTPMERIGNLQLTEAQKQTALLQRILDEGGAMVV